MAIINFSKLVGENLQTELYDREDWVEWRYCYSGGRRFRDEYLERFSDRETKKEFVRRRDVLTPIPAYARLEVNRVKNALSQRFPDIIRRGGTRAWQDAVAGIGRGVDRRGSAMNSYLAKYIVPEALVMRRVGVLVDAPRVTGSSAADVPENFRPYLNYYPVEHIERIIPAPVDSSSDWSAVMVRDVNHTFDVETGGVTDVESFRYYYLDPERGNLVTIVHIDDQGRESGAPVFTSLEKIPFVLFDVLESLIKDVCSYQIAHLNLISADTAYAVDANYPFMVRQRGNAIPAHLIGEDDSADIGSQKGLFYDKGLNAPGFISPPVDPLKTSLELRKAFKEEVHELVTGALASLGDDGTMDSGLAFIGGCLEDGESRLWDHWTAYEQADPARRRVPQILYPDDWSLKTDEERIDEANKYIDLMNKLPGQRGKKEASKIAYERLLRGRVPTSLLDAIKADVDSAPYTTSDAKIIIEAKREGLVSAETGSLSLGFDEGEAEKAKADQAERAAMIVAAQSDATNAGRGNPDNMADSDSVARAREGEADQDAEFNPGPGVRGEADAN